jgi:hypothetical protein
VRTWGSGPGPSAPNAHVQRARPCKVRTLMRALSPPGGHYLGHDDSAATAISSTAHACRRWVEHAAPSPVTGGGIFRPWPSTARLAV